MDDNERTSLTSRQSPPQVLGARPDPFSLLLRSSPSLLPCSILPIIVAFVLNRRFRGRNPEKRPYRWGYYFSVMSFIAGLGLGASAGFGLTAVIVCGLIYAVLAWFFAQRHHWAWIALTI